MAVSAEQALFEVVADALVGYDALWGDRAYPDEAPAGVERPYVVWFVASGGREMVTVYDDSARLTVSAKCVAASLGAAMQGQQLIGEALHDSGDQDVNPRLIAHTEWRVLTVTEGRVISLLEKYEGAASIYHRGHQYEFAMERV